MISDEGQLRAACLMRDAAQQAEYASGRFEESVRQLGFLLDPGYGGAVPRLAELLEAQEKRMNVSVGERFKTPDGREFERIA